TIEPHIPAVLSEVKKTRESLPGILDRADQVVAHAESVGQAASKGAVKGFLGGIVTAPFKLISEAGKGLTDAIGLTTQSGFTKEDDKLNQNATDSLLKSGAPGTQQQWSNPDSGNSGAIHWISQSLRDNKPCVTLHYDIRLRDGKTHEARVELCQQSDGSWKKWQSK
ncbi:MAG: hypothetical protein OEY67_07345, partial [Gammaproteobacteria bacterium]|nr:hypothetical protein [Gammaproteobacteria bacterium]